MKDNSERLYISYMLNTQAKQGKTADSIPDILKLWYHYNIQHCFWAPYKYIFTTLQDS
jgi:hypothetical protein